MNIQKAVWFFGLSGAGKTTLATLLRDFLCYNNVPAVLLDGDSLRRGLNRDLGFTPEDRSENIRRTAEVASLFLSAGIIPIIAAITPYEQDRRRLTEIMDEKRVLKVFVNSPLEVCEQRDTKGLYKKARKNLIQAFTGIHDVFERPSGNYVCIDTYKNSIEQSFEHLKKVLYET